MKETLFALIAYFKNPILKEDENTNLNYRFTLFLKIFAICVITGIIITPVFALLEALEWVNMDSHEVEKMFKGMAKWKVILTGAIIIPVIEELIFRAPITAFKKPKYFKIGFYFFALLFGFVHISNFEISTTVLLLSPILVLPQILIGFYLGYIRVRLGLQWSMLLHGCYNCFFILLSFIPEE
ncbi:CPBP family intramembrane metalloprotease [Polaribacter aestuariivivens]|uniref:CPBP family intramembrane metalloprotease n=1 Tax=Polaribacter aestuariivivens TaxID=2304626 RepID=A0A5S3N636_9FLAO|nr:CPBP family intramembrane glutamic endopeptidase [Polaribacter aestuariivivens]TMM28869.1 CPBP family intramembrane metalloprotease [Polaribacter aestuariivivens]